MKRYLLLFLLLCASMAQAQTIADKLTTLNGIKLDIKAALASKSQTVGDDFSIYDDAVASISTGYQPFVWGGGSDWTAATSSAVVDFQNDYAALASAVTDADGTNVAEYNASRIPFFAASGLSGLAATEDLATFTQSPPDTVGTYTEGALVDSTDSSFVGMVRLAEDRILLVPYFSDYIKFYDPVKNRTLQGPVAETTDSAFCDGVLTKSGKVVLVPRNAGYAGVYDPSTNTYTRCSGAVGTTNAFETGCLMPNGIVFLCPRDINTVGLVNIDTMTYSAGGTASTTDKAFLGCNVAKNGKVVLTPFNSPLVYTYDYTSNTCSPASGTTPTSTAAYHRSVVLPSGNICFPPYNADNVGIYYPDTNEFKTAALATSTDAAFYDGVLTSSGDVVFMPVTTTQPYFYTYNETTNECTKRASVIVGRAFFRIILDKGRLLLSGGTTDYIGIYDNGYKPVPLDALLHPLINH